MPDMDELNPKWVKSTLLAILQAVRGLDARMGRAERRFRKFEIGQEVMIRRLDKQIADDEKQDTEIASLNNAFDRHEDRIVRFEKKVRIAT